MPMRNTRPIPSRPSITASLAVTLLSSLVLSVAAQNAGDVNVRLTAPESGAEVALGAEVTITAEARVRNVDKSVAQVELLINNQSLGARTTTESSQYRWSWIAPAAGDFTLVAQATDSAGDTVASEPLALTIGDGWTYVDTTDAGGAVTYSTQINVGEGAEKAFDNSLETKWLTATGNATEMGRAHV